MAKTGADKTPISLANLDLNNTRMKEYVQTEIGKIEGVAVDNTLSDTGVNPVQGKVIKNAIDNKADKNHTHTTVNGHTVNADVPASADFSAYVKRLETIAIGDTFTPYPGQKDENGILTYCEYLRKRSDGRADKIFRVGDINNNKYSDLQAYYNGTDTVIWQLRKAGVNVAFTIDGKYVAVRDEIPSLAYVTGEFTISANQTKTISLGFKPTFVDVRGRETGYQINVEAIITDNGFKAEALDDLTNNASVKYIAFKK